MLFASPPQLHYLRLPKDISEDYVILMDSTVSTGAAALMAIRVLLVGPQGSHTRVRPDVDEVVEVLLSVSALFWRTTMSRRTRSSCCLCSWLRRASTRSPTPSPESASSPPLWTKRSTTSSTSFQASVRMFAFLFLHKSRKRLDPSATGSSHLFVFPQGTSGIGTLAPMHPPTGVRVMKGWTTDGPESLDAMEMGKRAIIPPYLKMAAMLAVHSNPDYCV